MLRSHVAALCRAAQARRRAGSAYVTAYANVLRDGSIWRRCALVKNTVRQALRQYAAPPVFVAAPQTRAAHAVLRRICAPLRLRRYVARGRPTSVTPRPHRVVAATLRASHFSVSAPCCASCRLKFRYAAVAITLYAYAADIRRHAAFSPILPLIQADRPLFTLMPLRWLLILMPTSRCRHTFDASRCHATRRLMLPPI